ncbi:MAG: Eco57I restriction-modification methylase domain-containing protein, partial [Lachnospiraceae bacterium]|nr:Eco57I restriction-modification methylase domain-containing protein [Lachnospiraceae bacterium]
MKSVIDVIQGEFNTKSLQDGKEQIMPEDTSDDMITILDDKPIDKNMKFLEVCSSDCRLAVSIYNFLMKKLDNTECGFANGNEKSDWILSKMIYVVASSTMAMIICRKTLYGDMNTEGNVILIDGINDIVQKDFKNNTNEFEKIIKVKFGDNNMKFDVVVGNPPYNNDLYIPFVIRGHALSKQYSIWITPAKWQAKNSSRTDKSGNIIDGPNELFRKNIVPYIAKAVFYKNSTDIFTIEEWGGIAYYLIDKYTHTDKLVKSVCGINSILASDFEVHDEDKLNLYNRNILKIIGKVGTLGWLKQSMYVQNTDHGEISIDGTLGFRREIFTGEQDRGEICKTEDYYVEVMQGENVVGYRKKSELYTTFNLDKYKCICIIMGGGGTVTFDKNGQIIGMVYISIIGPNQVPKGSFPVLRYFDTRDEAESFVSYLNAKLIRFLYYIGCCGTTITKEFFRFIPDQIKYDHIFTDAELYEKYNLTDE